MSVLAGSVVDGTSKSGCELPETGVNATGPPPTSVFDELDDGVVASVVILVAAVVNGTSRVGCELPVTGVNATGTP